MSRSLHELTESVAQVSDTYSRLFEIDRNDDWYILKLQEELGELTAEHLRLTGRGRLKDQSRDTIIAARDDEAADVLATLLLYARHNGIDLEAALERKWLRYLRPAGETG